MSATTSRRSPPRRRVTLPILPVLAETMAAGPCGDLAFICGARGEPLTKESFGNDFRDACKAAGVSGSAHGVRKIAATRAAESGATVAELEAIFGWSGGRMASLYTQSANRRKLAMAAMHKLNNERTSIPLHVGGADSAHAGRCVEAGGHRPRRGWAGPICPFGGEHRG
jgi:hypothetical protein